MNTNHIGNAARALGLTITSTETARSNCRAAGAAMGCPQHALRPALKHLSREAVQSVVVALPNDMPRQGEPEGRGCFWDPIHPVWLDHARALH